MFTHTVKTVMKNKYESCKKTCQQLFTKRKYHKIPQFEIEEPNTVDISKRRSWSCCRKN